MSKDQENAETATSIFQFIQQDGTQGSRTIGGAEMNMTEGVRRRHEWLQVDAGLRKTLRDLRLQFGSLEAKCQERSDQGSWSYELRCMWRFNRPRPVRLPNQYDRMSSTDTFSWTRSTPRTSQVPP